MGTKNVCSAGSLSFGWGRIFATLIQHGHRASDLTDYTLRQLMLYYGECLQNDNARLAAGIMAVNLGFAGGKEATRAIKGLTRRG
jgi:hypothetical protein